MPAASYREVPDGHSSRKQKSKRRRAKRSPSFVSGRVIGHCDISPRCIPECSAMALHRAVPAARPSRASTLSFVLLAGAFSKSCLRCRFFLRGGRQLFGAGRIQAFVHGKIFAKCVLGRLVVTRFRHGAFPGARRWQNARAVRPPQHLAVAGLRPDALLARLAVAIFSRGAFPGVLPWQDSAAVRSRASIRGKFCAPCIPKAASDGKIASP